MKRNYVLGGFLVFLLSMLLGAATLYGVRPYFVGQKVLYNEKKVEENTINEEEDYPFTGWKDKPRQRALAVVIDNTEEARPQAGLERADLVFELPVEGGLTRFVAIMCAEDLDLIGPIRSARPYFIEIAKEYEAVLIHAGGSEEALKIIQKESLDHFDEINGGGQVASCFWRLPDRGKPHNLFTSSDVLRHALKKMNLNRPAELLQRLILPLETEIEGDEVKALNIFYVDKSSMASFFYNERKKVFQRFTPDNESFLTYLGNQLEVANIIVQIVPYCYTDGDGHLQLIMHGEGEALVFRKGKVVPALWQKTPGEVTSFTDKKGQPIAFLEGLTWISVVPRGIRIDVN